MASKRPFCDADFLCAVCHDVFDRPVALLCGHSFCRDCVEQYWSVSDSRQCPMCRQISANTPSLNLALGNLCQAFLHHKRHLEELCENMELMQQADFECDLLALKMNVRSFTNYLQMLKGAPSNLLHSHKTFKSKHV
uniref:RING-type domain-containing protein n=1 Tax=Sinocyclocheilus anshuiensis TaxID=1608454 RepID=A0A671N8C4_9TELE